MAILRVAAPTSLAGTPPPWSLTTMDQNDITQYAALNDASLGYVNGVLADTGTINNYAVAVSIGLQPSAYNPGMTVFFKPNNTNNGPSSISVFPLGSVPILTSAGNALQVGELIANQVVGLVYSNIAPVGFRLITPIYLATGFTYTVPTNPTIECAGYNGVSILIIMQGNATSGVALNHLADGVPVSVVFWNQRGVASAYFITCTNSNGVARAVQTAFPSNVNGTGFISLATGTTIGASGAMIYTGQAGNGTLWLGT